MKLYSAWYCPFAQRVWMGLNLKGAGFEIVETDPYNKTPEWMQISAGTGQVPVLVGGGGPTHVPDSLRGLEFIDAFYSELGPAFYPADPAEAAEVRRWTDVLSARVVPYFYRFLKAQPGSDLAEAARYGLEEGLESLTLAADPVGSFFRGAEIGALDLALAPFSYRISLILAHYRGYRLQRTGPVWERFHRWAEALRTHSAFRATQSGPDYEARLIGFYQQYADGAGQRGVDVIPA
ncbi:glutathione S-transferase family protein [Oricola sp.]|uniref:glutathione S-transferase family protein n=1 Tax=Oricola sp. TaxID=1979950 RepID=UPI003BAD175C